MSQQNSVLNGVRPVTIQRDYIKADGSVLISFGDTKVLCTATIEESVPPFLRNQNTGWVTAEYAMLPGATRPRTRREAKSGKQSGRTQEIQRLIGRSLRAVIDLDQLGERSILIDADVIQADGGTRTAAVTGGMIAMYDAVQTLMNKGCIKTNPIREWVAAVSVGIRKGRILVDLCYEEDSNADVDMNVVMTESGRFVEIQGTAEKEPFDATQLQQLLGAAQSGINSLFSLIKPTA